MGLVVYYYFHEKGLYLTAVPVNRPVLKAVNLARPPRAAFLMPRRVGRAHLRSER